MLNWNEIRDRATKFSRDWSEEKRETAEYQTFWNEFFEVFGIKRRTVARYQERVELIKGGRGYIDLFWPGVLIAEHKTAGEDLDEAYKQASSYFDALSEEDRPRYICLADYSRVRLYDLEAEGEISKTEFSLRDFPKHIREFGFIAGFETRKYKEEDPANRKAVKIVVKLYDALNSGHYPKEDLSVLLVRLVFLFFADDSGIFKKDIFKEYVEYFTKEDGSDLGPQLHQIFEVLNTPENQRQTNITSDLNEFPYVNGNLFANFIALPFFDKEMRLALLDAARFNWGKVSPAIFGSMFQFVMDADNPKIRHDLGAHYTSEKNILKLIGPLFLDELKEELEKAGVNQNKLMELWGKLSQITLFDPACGCGNFLVVAYRELRLLELEIIKRLHKKDLEESKQFLQFDVSSFSKLSVERMFGIEILPFPTEIARLSLWLTDHQINSELGQIFGVYFAKLPLREQPHITCGNSLTMDWETIVSKNKLSYILGNPPFIGAKLMSEEQRQEVVSIFGNKKGSGILDYVTAWYKKSAEYINGTKIKCAFVSTNSITQGEQVSILWEEMDILGISIYFAHKTFKWNNEAPGSAGVYCVIIGFANFLPTGKLRLFEYEKVGADPHEILVSQINPYLVDAPSILIKSRQKPLSDIPKIGIGNKPIDNGFYLFTLEEKEKFVSEEPKSEIYFRRWLGADEFINGYERWCLWLGDCPPDVLKSMPVVMRRIDMVREYRLMSKSEPTIKLASTPTRFHVENIPKKNYLVIPKTSSENRRYIPIGFIDPDVLSGDALFIVGEATLYHFGVLESEMHMAWTRAVCGRLEMRYRYSKDIVYNNFPWPIRISELDKRGIEDAAQKVLNVRVEHKNSTLADLYDPLTMPKDLLDAHRILDTVVDRAYGKKTSDFSTESSRLKFLFGLYKEFVEK
jgi:hypothetical protein